MKRLVVIPTYNERENIESLLNCIYERMPDLHILVVDDNSPDETRAIVERLQSSGYTGRLHILNHPRKLGLGRAYIDGIKWGLSEGYDLIVEMDGDFSHDPRYLEPFFEEIDACDLVIGSRYVDGGAVSGWGTLRKVISRGGGLYSRLVLGIPYRDLTGGFKCFRSDLLRKLNLDEVKSSGYSFQVELTYRAHLLGASIKEVPIVFRNREQGRSKMSGGIFVEAALMVLRLKFGSLYGAVR